MENALETLVEFNNTSKIEIFTRRGKLVAKPQHEAVKDCSFGYTDATDKEKEAAIMEATLVQSFAELAAHNGVPADVIKSAIPAILRRTNSQSLWSIG